MDCRYVLKLQRISSYQRVKPRRTPALCDIVHHQEQILIRLQGAVKRFTEKRNFIQRRGYCCTNNGKMRIIESSSAKTFTLLWNFVLNKALNFIVGRRLSFQRWRVILVN